MKQNINEVKRMQQLAGLINENQENTKSWWTKANDELGLDFDDDIYSYLDSYDEPWQGKFAEEVTNIDAVDYEDFKAQVEDLYNEIYPG